MYVSPTTFQTLPTLASTLLSVATILFSSNAYAAPATLVANTPRQSAPPIVAIDPISLKGLACIEQNMGDQTFAALNPSLVPLTASTFIAAFSPGGDISKPLPIGKCPTIPSASKKAKCALALPGEDIKAFGDGLCAEIKDDKAYKPVCAKKFGECVNCDGAQIKKTDCQNSGEKDNGCFNTIRSVPGNRFEVCASLQVACEYSCGAPDKKAL